MEVTKSRRRPCDRVGRNAGRRTPCGSGRRAPLAFLPPRGGSRVVKALGALEAAIGYRSETEGEMAIPPERMLEAVERGAVPFRVQGTIPGTRDGGGRLAGILAEH